MKLKAQVSKATIKDILSAIGANLMVSALPARACNRTTHQVR